MKQWTKLDKLCSLLVRIRDDWTCQRCGKKYKPPTSALHWAHFITRTRHNTRWNPENASTLCYGCHSYLDRNFPEKRKFFVDKLGERKVQEIEIAGEIAARSQDKTLIEIYLKEELKKQKSQEGSHIFEV